MPRAIVVVGGAAPDARICLPDARFVVAADSGYDHALALGLAVDVLVGDLDSISAAGLEHARTHGVRVEQHDPEKDATDTELALATAAVSGATRPLM